MFYFNFLHALVAAISTGTKLQQFSTSFSLFNSPQSFTFGITFNIVKTFQKAFYKVTLLRFNKVFMLFRIDYFVVIYHIATWKWKSLKSILSSKIFLIENECKTLIRFFDSFSIKNIFFWWNRLKAFYFQVTILANCNLTCII